MSQPGQVAIVEQATLNIKKEGFQKRVSHFGKDQFPTLMGNSDCVNDSVQAYKNQIKFIQDSERARWEDIDFRYMTEESDSDSGLIRQNKLEWRGTGI